MEEMCALSMKSAEITKASGQISAVFCKFFCKPDRLSDFRPSHIPDSKPIHERSFDKNGKTSKMNNRSVT